MWIAEFGSRSLLSITWWAIASYFVSSPWKLAGGNNISCFGTIWIVLVLGQIFIFIKCRIMRTVHLHIKRTFECGVVCAANDMELFRSHFQIYSVTSHSLSLSVISRNFQKNPTKNIIGKNLISQRKTELINITESRKKNFSFLDACKISLANWKRKTGIPNSRRTYNGTYKLTCCSRRIQIYLCPYLWSVEFFNLLCCSYSKLQRSYKANNQIRMEVRKLLCRYEYYRKTNQHRCRSLFSSTYIHIASAHKLKIIYIYTRCWNK